MNLIKDEPNFWRDYFIVCVILAAGTLLIYAKQSRGNFVLEHFFVGLIGVWILALIFALAFLIFLKDKNS